MTHKASRLYTLKICIFHNDDYPAPIPAPPLSPPTPKCWPAPENKVWV